MRNKYLVIGGDSLVGSEVYKNLLERNHQALCTTRRRDTIGEGRILFDFQDEATYQLPEDIDYAFVIAAATNYERCETDPMSHTVNVELIPAAIASLLKQGIFVTYISTNSVFGGDIPWPSEDEAHHPQIAYAKQKSESEKRVKQYAKSLGKENFLNIVRLTKILDVDTPPLPKWLEIWGKGDKVKPFSDLIFSPMSKKFVANALVSIAEKKVSGNLHLSGADNVSYLDLATLVADKNNISRNLIESTTSVEQNVHIAFKPKYSGLGMDRTTQLCDIKPQLLSNVVSDLYNS